MNTATSDVERHTQAWQHVYSAGTERHATSIPTPPQQSQSGWFPLEDALVLDSSSSTVLGPMQQQQQQQQLRPPPPPQDMYAAESLLPSLTSETPDDRWMPSEPYAHDPSSSSRFVQQLPAARHDQHAAIMYPLSQQQHAPVYSVHELPNASYAWTPHSSDDTRFSASHTTMPDQFDATYAADRAPAQPHFYPLPSALASPMMRPPQLYPPLHYDSTGSLSHLTPPPPTRRKAKAIAIGRWSADEHKWFLKGLEMFQGPAWGEIARLIGSRTSTQVRTHAQKFFTKLARLNQTLPYFAAQIQRERSRLEALSGSSSVTPTAATSAFSFALSSLSPHKRVETSSTTGCSTKRESSYCTSTSASEFESSSDAVYQQPPRVAVYEADHTRASDSSSFYYTQDSNTDGFRLKCEADVTSPLLRKARVCVDSSEYEVAGMPVLALPSVTASDASFDVGSHEQQPHGSAYAPLGLARDSSGSGFDSARLMPFSAEASPMSGSFSLLPASSSSAADPWNSDDAAQRQWLAAPLDSSSSHQVPALDADSLPSMHKLLFRGA